MRIDRGHRPEESATLKGKTDDIKLDRFSFDVHLRFLSFFLLHQTHTSSYSYSKPSHVSQTFSLKEPTSTAFIMDHVKNFLSNSNKETSTEVCSEIGPEVVQETISKHVHVESATAVDRERHIHHHQHRVQPIAATEHLAEQHVTQVAPEVTRERVEKLSAEKEALLAQQHGAIQNTRAIGATIQTQENLGVTASEHVHHHVHEHITPVIQKDTHEHKVLHQVELIHEKIHEAPIIHETTTLPTISLDEFRAKTQAGDAVHNHGDSQHSHHFYSGLPKVQDGHSAVGSTGAPSAAPGTYAHTDVAGHQHNSGVAAKAASAVERRA